MAEAHPDAFEIVGLSAFRNVALLAEQASRLGVKRVVVGEGTGASGLLPTGLEVGEGGRALEDLAQDPRADLVVNALVGAAGLGPTVASLRAGKTLALANKESLVMAGAAVASIVSTGQGRIVPIDSEHSSIFRCLRGTASDEVAGLLLTASGGPLRDLPVEAMAAASVEQVLSHPTWDMGEKVTVDSATLANKAMEVIEARWLFDIPYERIDVVIHRESIVHSLVRLADGSLLAHLGTPDMRVPIQYALFYPDAPRTPYGECRLEEIGALRFAPVDRGRYPCFELILSAGRVGGTAPAIAATADEVATAAFLDGRIRFGEIAHVIEQCLSAVTASEADDLDAVLAAEEEARLAAEGVVERLAGRRSRGR